MNQVLTIQISPEELTALVEGAVQRAMGSQPRAQVPIKEPLYLDLKQASELLRLKPSTLYSYICKRKINYVKRSGKILFKRTDLLSYLDDGHHLTAAQIKDAV